MKALMMKTTDKPTIQEFHLEGIKHVQAEDAWEALSKDEAVLIDVREDYETVAYVENAQFHPMDQILSWLPAVPSDKPVIILCKMGIRSTHVARVLAEKGYSNAANLDGGFEAWKARGLPYITRPRQ
jgi:rhodanese-related sulfurtransferase